MSREILFRGRKCRNNIGDWVEGGFTPDAIGNPRITTVDSSGAGLEFHEVIPETVGQFTGLRDNKRTKEFPEGQRIFEGDIVTTSQWNQSCWERPEFAKGEFDLRVVTWGNCAWELPNIAGIVPSGIGLKTGTAKRFETIGSIHTHPELLK